MRTCSGQRGNCKLKQALFEGKADTDPSAFANEVLLPICFYLLDPCTLGGGGVRAGSGLHWMGSEQKPKFRVKFDVVYSSTASAGEHAEQLGASSELPFRKQSRSVRKLCHCQRVVVVRCSWDGADIGEPDKCPVGNSHKQIEICPDVSLDLKLTGQCLHNSWSNNKQFVMRL